MGQIPKWWSWHDCYRFCEPLEFNANKAVKDIIEHWDWLSELKTYNLSEKAANILKNGTLYIHGRDYKGNVNIFTNISKVDTSNEGLACYKEAQNFLLAVLKKYMLLPYYTERYNLIIDLTDVSMWGIPIGLIQD